MKRTAAIILTLALVLALATSAFAAPSPSGGGEVTPPSPSTPGASTWTQQLSDGTKVETTTFSTAEGISVKVVETTPKDGTAEVKVNLTVPATAAAARVNLPVEEVTNTTVIMKVMPDGSKKIVKSSLATDDGISFKADGSGEYVVVDNAPAFTDTDAHWGESEIDFVAARGLFEGINADEKAFAPTVTVSFDQVCVVLARYADENIVTTGANWAAPSVEWAATAGLSEGITASDEITREDLVIMLWRAMGKPEVTQDLSSFKDADSVNSEASSAMQWAVNVGIIKGTDTGELNPQGNTTRAELAAIVARFCKLG